jgi:hypothetical protein
VSAERKLLMMGFNLALSLALRALPYARYVLIAGLALGVYFQGRGSAQREAALADAKATIEVLQEATRRNALAAEQATQAANRRALNERNLQNKVDDYEDALKARADAGCLLNDDDVGRLHEFK